MSTKTEFWQEYLKRAGNTTSLDTPKRYERAMRQAKDHFVQAIETFQQELSKIPIGAEIEAWLQSLDLPKEKIAEYEMHMLQLIDLGLLPLVNQSGELRTLIELTPNEHQAIIEEIRCSSKLTTLEKEKMVETYVLFSQQLSRDTCRLIMQGEDPDFQRTIKKVVNYREFIKFVQELQERDALIAKLLYFGAPTMDEVLNLRVSQVDLKKGIVKFNKFSVRYPKHVMLDLKGYLTKKDKEELIFVNLRGEMVERTHLNNCFNRASRKISSTKRITPKMLLESDVANSVAANWPFKNLSIQ
jgi:hypothetical protein